MALCDARYADRRLSSESAWWKHLLDVQRPYRNHLRRLRLGLVLEVGCGIGRNLDHLRGSSVGVDRDPRAVEIARSRGLPAFTPEELSGSEWSGEGRFDSILFSHVLEHMTAAQAKGLLQGHLPLLRGGGTVVIITPQEAGFRADPTHVQFMGFEEIAAIASGTGLQIEAQYSFPFPRLAGRFFKYNEFVTVARKRP